MKREVYRENGKRRTRKTGKWRERVTKKRLKGGGEGKGRGWKGRGGNKEEKEGGFECG